MVYFFSEIGSRHSAQAGLQLVMKAMLASNSKSSCLTLLSAGVTDVCHHAWLLTGAS